MSPMHSVSCTIELVYEAMTKLKPAGRHYSNELCLTLTP